MDLLSEVLPSPFAPKSLTLNRVSDVSSFFEVKDDNPKVVAMPAILAMPVLLTNSLRSMVK